MLVECCLLPLYMYVTPSAEVAMTSVGVSQTLALWHPDQRNLVSVCVHSVQQNDRVKESVYVYSRKGECVCAMLATHMWW